MLNCDLNVGESIRVDGPCVIYFSRRKSAKRITLSIAADRSVKIVPPSQPMPHETEECFSGADVSADGMSV